jgi:ADP-heptose:LPS heptosyltransferase
MKVLVLQSGKLGDMVCTTPVFRALKEAKAAVLVAGDALNAEVLRGNPNIENYFDIATLTAADLRREAIDTAVLLNPNPRLLKMLLRARIPKIIVPKVVGGFSPYMSLSYRLWSLCATRMPHRMGHYAPQEYLTMLSALGISSTDTRKDIVIDPIAQQKADELLAPYPQARKVAIAPGAGNKIKEWPPEKFNEVAKALAEQGALVVLIGAGADKTLAQIVASGVSPQNVFDTTGRLSIEELKGVIKRMDLFVSADTGPIYIAEALGIATVDIVGPMDEREQPPKGPRNLVVTAPGAREPQLHIMNARVYDGEKARQQIEAISTRQVLDAIHTLL